MSVTGMLRQFDLIGGLSLVFPANVQAPTNSCRSKHSHKVEIRDRILHIGGHGR
jgi:hypothetical protein